MGRGLMRALGGFDPNWTATEKHYWSFLFGTPAERADAIEHLVRICAHAVGHLTPPWQGRENGKWHPDFHALRHKARVPWVRRWVIQQLQTFQTDWCRYIGRRCKNALIGEIRRSQTKAARAAEMCETPARWVNVEDGALFDASGPEYIPSPERERKDHLATLNKHIKYASKKSAFTDSELALIRESLKSGRQTNTAYAAKIGMSEGYVRKLKKSILDKFRLAKKERREHYWNGTGKKKIPTDRFVGRGRWRSKPVITKVKNSRTN